MKEIAVALLKAQKEMGNAIKGSKNPFFKSKYADLNAVREASLPVLNNNGISVLQRMYYEQGLAFLETQLLHESGESISSSTPIIVAKQNDPQALGSAISYARRYGLQSMVCLGAEDDDGETAMDRKPKLTKETPGPLALAIAAVNDKKTTKDAIVILIQKLGGNDKGPVSECIKTLSPEGLLKFIKEMEKLNG